MNIKLLTEHHLEFQRLKGGCTGSSESTCIKIPAGSQKAARNRQDSITKKNVKHKLQKDPQKKHRLGTVSKKLLEGLNMFNSTNFTLNSDVDQDACMFGLHERSLT